ncbi:hypothetical protein [Helicobacter pylori]|uniref:hypothetical protein n=1 Tax=Helicobacter pylori TaxID=210 RepID=UPI0013E3A9AF|nr:hypothetical protein [Helicobacter pylori]
MSGVHIVENTNNEKIENTITLNPTASTPPNNEELLKLVGDLKDRFKKLEYKLEDLEPLIKISRCIGCFFRKFSNDTQENSKDALKKEEVLKKVQEENTALNKEKTDLTEKNKDLSTEKDNLTKANTELIEKIKL